jgi:nitric oxide dioxygenase
MTSWKGFKELLVTDRVVEDEVTVSLYLKEKDGSKLPDYKPGQFLVVKAKLEDGSWTKPRAYSLSSEFKGDYYRISIKREELGEVSPVLCDKVKEGDVLMSTAPSGHFVLQENERPAVFIGGGIGITPMLAMAESLEGATRQAHLLYSTRNSKYHSFQEEIKAISDHYDNVKTAIFYTRPLEGEIAGKDFDYQGRINGAWMEKHLPKDGDYYFCGPVPFMKTMYHLIVDLGIPKERIFYELFESGADITKND